MAQVRANGIDLEVETHGDPAGPALLLIMGLGMQLSSWPEPLVQGLVDAGYYVIRHDNRDVGLSSKFDHAGAPKIIWETIKYALRLPVKTAYTLDQMADDSVGVLDALGVREAHVVGVSMGGMVAQVLAARHALRVRTLTSIMSSTGRRGLPGPTREARRVLMARPRGDAPEDLLNHYVRLFKVIGSPAFPPDETELRARILRGLQRSAIGGATSAGVLRQMTAIAAGGSRVPLLAGVRAPTLVVHGSADPLVPLECGRDTARAIPAARLEIIEGMGHDLPPAVVAKLLELIPAHAR